jgi:hypothetical protein
MLILLLPCGQLFASTFAPVGAPRDPVAGPTGSLDSTKGLKAGSRVPKPDRAGLGPTARITTIPEFVAQLSQSSTEASPGPTARAWRGGAIGTNCAVVHIRFRSPAPQRADGGTFDRAGRGSGPALRFEFGAIEARSAELQVRTLSSIGAAPSASRLLLRLPRCAAPAPGSFRGSKETFGPSKGLLGRRSSGESELLFARALVRSRGATKTSTLGMLAKARLSNPTKQRSTGIPALRAASCRAPFGPPSALRAPCARSRGNDALVARAASHWVPAFAGMTSERRGEPPSRPRARQKISPTQQRSDPPAFSISSISTVWIVNPARPNAARVA